MECGERRADIFKFLMKSLSTDSREVYLNFDHSWLNKVLFSKYVEIRKLNRENLGSFRDDLSLDQDFKFIVSFQDEITPLGHIESEVIDEFLTNNPCWIPLHDPVVALPGNLTNKMHTHTDDIVYEGMAIFVRLPTYPFRPTCLLYSLITQIQFPNFCPTDEVKFKSHWIGNIGWANAVHTLTQRFVGALHNSLIFLTPRGMHNGAEPTLVIKGIIVAGPWSWADRTECELETFAFNPWHCFFISLSKCNTAAVHDAAFVDHGLESPKNTSEFMRSAAEISETRIMYGDAGTHATTHYPNLKEKGSAFLYRNLGIR